MDDEEEGFGGAKGVKRQLEQEKIELEEIEEAATHIQALYKGRKVRKAIKAKRRKLLPLGTIVKEQTAGSDFRWTSCSYPKENLHTGAGWFDALRNTFLTEPIWHEVSQCFHEQLQNKIKALGVAFTDLTESERHLLCEEIESNMYNNQKHRMLLFDMNVTADDVVRKHVVERLAHRLKQPETTLLGQLREEVLARVVRHLKSASVQRSLECLFPLLESCRGVLPYTTRLQLWHAVLREKSEFAIEPRRHTFKSEFPEESPVDGSLLEGESFDDKIGLLSPGARSVLARFKKTVDGLGTSYGPYLKARLFEVCQNFLAGSIIFNRLTPAQAKQLDDRVFYMLIGFLIGTNHPLERVLREPHGVVSEDEEEGKETPKLECSRSSRRLFPGFVRMLKRHGISVEIGLNSGPVQAAGAVPVPSTEDLRDAFDSCRAERPKGEDEPPATLQDIVGYGGYEIAESAEVKWKQQELQRWLNTLSSTFFQGMMPLHTVLFLLDACVISDFRFLIPILSAHVIDAEGELSLALSRGFALHSEGRTVPEQLLTPSNCTYASPELFLNVLRRHAFIA